MRAWLMGGVMCVAMGCAVPWATRATLASPAAETVPSASHAPPTAASMLANMSTRDKASQILMAYPQLDKAGPVPYGGVVFVGALLKDLDGARTRITDAKARSAIDPFFAVDMEGGAFNRMPHHPELTDLPSAEKMASLPDAQVEAWGRRVGRAMRDIGLNMNLAPVLDVAERGHMRNNKRSWSGDPDVVVTKALAFARGLKAEGIVPVGKHFPGYGNISGDTDHGLVSADWSSTDLGRHMDVFRRAKGELDAVMMSNIVYTTRGTAPATLEPSLVADAHAMNMLTVTDDLAIRALGEPFGGDPKEVVKRAFLAGNDLLLTTAPPDWDRGVNYVGIITELADSDPAHMAVLDAAAGRVLAWKERLGMLGTVP